MRVTSLWHRLSRNTAALSKAAIVSLRGLFKRRSFRFAALAAVLATGSAYAATAAEQVSNNNGQTATHASVETVSQQNAALHTTVDAHSDGTQNPDVSTSTDANISSTITPTRTDVTVNGEPVEVPPNGSTHKTIASENGHTFVDITNSSSGTASNSSTATLNIRIESESTGGISND